MNVCVHIKYLRMYVYSILRTFCETLIADVFSLASASSLSLQTLLLYATDLLLVHYYYIQSCIQFSIMYLTNVS